MFVNHLLPAFAVDNNRKIIERLDMASNLETIGQVDRYRNAFLAELIQKRILNINRFVHQWLPPGRFASNFRRRMPEEQIAIHHILDRT